MKKFIGWFQSFFDEDDGASTTRALTWIWTLTLCGSIILLVAASVINAIRTKDLSKLQLPAIDSAYILLTTAFLTAKVIQKGWGEKDSGTTTTSITLPSGSFSSSITSAPGVTTTNVSGSLGA